MRMLKWMFLVLSLAVHGAELPGDGGIGVVLGVEGQNIVVKRILPDSPAAAQHDLHVGDRILAVAQDKEPAIQVESGKLAQTIPLIRDPKGTTVRLTLLSAGEDESRARVMSFVRGEVKVMVCGRKEVVTMPVRIHALALSDYDLGDGDALRLRIVAHRFSGTLDSVAIVIKLPPSVLRRQRR